MQNVALTVNIHLTGALGASFPQLNESTIEQSASGYKSNPSQDLALEYFKRTWAYFEKCSKVQLDNFIFLIKLDSDKYNLEYYQPRRSDSKIKACFDQKKDLLIHGQSGVGKTRFAVELLRGRPEAWVLIPFKDGYKASELPSDLSSIKEEAVLFYDDLDNFEISVDPINLALDLSRRKFNSTQILATSKDISLSKIQERFPKFYEQACVLQIVPMDKDEASSYLNILIPDQETDGLESKHTGLPGKMLVEINQLESKYIQMTLEEQSILKACKLLSEANIQYLASDLVLATCNSVFDQSLDEERFRTFSNELEQAGVLKMGSKSLNIDGMEFVVVEDKFYFKINEIYLQTVVDYFPIEEDFDKVATLINDADDFFFIGVKYLELGEFQKSVVFFDKSLTLASNKFETWYNLGVCYDRLCNSTKAIECYSEALKINPDFNQAKNNLASAYLDSEQLESANILLMEVLQVEPQSETAQANMGIYNYQTGKYDLALKYYQKALEINPNNSHVLNNLGLLYEVSGRLDEALECYRNALLFEPKFDEALHNLGNIKFKKKDFDSAIEFFSKAISINEYNYRAYGNRGIAFTQLGRSEEAIIDFKSALRIKPDDSKFFSSLVQQLLSLKRFEELIVQCENFIGLSTDQKSVSEAWNNMGFVLTRHETRDILRALECFKMAVQNNPQNYIALKNLGVSYQQAGMFSEAKEVLVQAEVLNPNDPDLLRILAYNLDRLEDNDLAIKYYEKSLSIEEDYIAYHNLANIFKNRGNKIKTKYYFKQALKVSPNSYDTLNDLGVLYAETDNFDQAIQLFKRSTEINPNNPIGWHNLGFTYRQKQTEENILESIRAFSQAVKANDAYFSSWYQMGNSYLEIGNFDLAIVCYQRTISIKEDYSEAWLHLGIAYYNKALQDNNRQLLNKAQENLMKSIEIRPFAQAYITCAYISEELGDLNKAINLYDEAIKLDPVNAKYFYDKALAHEKNHEPEKAVSALSEAINFKKEVVDALNHFLQKYPDFLSSIRENADFHRLISEVAKDKDTESDA